MDTVCLSAIQNQRYSRHLVADHQARGVVDELGEHRLARSPGHGR